MPRLRPPAHVPALLALACLGCADVRATDAPDAARVVVHARDTTLPRGATAALVADVMDGRGKRLPNASPKWTSRAPRIAVVSGKGVVTTRAAGRAYIVAEVGGRMDSLAVVVSDSAAPEPGPGDELLWEDSFDRPSREEQLAPYETRGVIERVAGREGAGLRFVYSDVSTDNLIEKDLGRPSTDTYFRYWYRISRGADLSCGDRNGSGMKWFMAWRPAGHLRYTMSVNSLDGSPFQGRENAGMEFTSHDQSSATEPDPWLSNVDHRRRFSTTNDGAWHRYTLHIVTGSGGYEQIWIDGAPVLDNRAERFDHSPVGVSMIQFPGVVVRWYPGCDFTIDVDDLAVWRR